MSSSESDEEQKEETIFDTEAFEWVEAMVNQMFSTSEKNWLALKRNEGSIRLLIDFIDPQPVDSGEIGREEVEDLRMITFYTKSMAKESGVEVCRNFPSSSSVSNVKKIGYFYKLEQNLNLTKLSSGSGDGNFGDVLKYGTIGEKPLEDFHQVLHQTFKPLLLNSEALASWPLAVNEEIMRLFHKSSMALDIVIGLSEGHTTLPLPMHMDLNEENSERQPGKKKSIVDVNSPGGKTPLVKMASSAKKGDDSGTSSQEGLTKVSYHEVEDTVQIWISQMKELMNRGAADFLRSKDDRFDCVKLVHFWEVKAIDLTYIRQQLRGPQTQKVIQILSDVKSAYIPSFKRISREIEHAYEEAKDFYLHLKCLLPYFEVMTAPNETRFFEEMHSCVRPAFYVLKLIADNSKFLGRTSALSQVVSLIFDETIHQIQLFGSRTNIFQVDYRESKFMIESFLSLSEELLSLFQVLQTATESNQDCNLENIEAVGTITTFIERLTKIASVIKATSEFEKLENLEIGGPKGKILSAKLKEIHQGIMKACAMFKETSFGPFDFKDERFDITHKMFLKTIGSCESSMGSTISEGLQCCCSPSHFMSMLDTFQEFADHDHVKKYIDDQLGGFLTSVDQELEAVLSCFHKQSILPPISSNLPPITASILWAKSLLKRLEPSIERVKSFQNENVLCHQKELEQLTLKYECIKTDIESYINSMSSAWVAKEGSVGDTGLNEHIFVKRKVNENGNRVDEDSNNDGPKTEAGKEEGTNNTISTNFDPRVMAIIKEVKYYENLELSVDLPSDVKTLGDVGPSLEGYLRTATLITDKYNKYEMEIEDIERALLSDRIAEIQRLLDSGCTDLTWNSSNIESFLNDLVEKVYSITKKLHTVQDNYKKIIKSVQGLSERVVDKIKDPKGILNIDTIAEYFQERNNNFAEVSNAIVDLIESNRTELGAAEDSKAWSNYLKFVSQRVLQELFIIVERSLNGLLEVTDPHIVEQQGMLPFISVKLSLAKNDVTYVPAIDRNTTPSIHSIIENVVDNIMLTLTHIEKIDKSSPDFFTLLSEHKTIRRLRDIFKRRLDFIVDEIRYQMASFDEYSYLWSQSKDEYMEYFLKYGFQVGNTEEDEPEPRKPSLDDFQMQMARFIDAGKTMKASVTKQIVNKWVIVDKGPIIHTLGSVIKGWKNVFTSYLISDIRNTIHEYSKDFERLSDGLSKKVERSNVIETMSYIKEMKAKEEMVDASFFYFEDSIQMLESFEVEIPPEIPEDINSLHLQWENVLALATNVRDVLNPLCDEEAELIRKKRRMFFKALDRYKGAYKTNAPYSNSVDFTVAYQYLDQFWMRLKRLKAEATALKESEELFDLTVSETDVEIDRCIVDLKLLYSVWNISSLVRGMFEQWYSTEWKKIDMEELEVATRRLVREIRATVGENESVKKWEIYKELDLLVKNMKVSIKASSQLSHVAVKKRHWKQLMEITGIVLPEENTFTFRQFLDLKLLDFQDDVSEIVDKAIKEYSMDKSLTAVQESWINTAYPYAPLPQYESVQIKVDSQFQEKLEEDQVLLQNLLSSKFVAHFYSDILAWQKKLAQIENVFIGWTEIQHAWLNMAEIFKSSADLRSKLPKETEEFDQLHNDWKDVLEKLASYKSAIEASEHPGILQTFDKFLKNFQRSEKALTEYLNSKRNEFPRFYFVSSHDLMDILAHGHEPRKISNHCSKIFDNIGKLEFKDDESSKEVIAVVSSEGERVPLQNSMMADGVVTKWLGDLLTNVRGTLAEILNDAVSGYEDKPRHVWMFDSCAQLTIVAGQIWFATEVQIAFDRILQGHESSLVDYHRKQIKQISTIVDIIRGDLSPLDRQKLVSLCTNDVHARDVISTILNDDNEISSNMFIWQSQLRYRWDENTLACLIDICDANFDYNFEYIGNCGRLVVTPLTDRCYITLTQSIRLMLGGAPTGPAGTGKTETVKELGRALGNAVFVFNCSDQMDYRSLGNIFRGLAETGTWGCFDEFNRIPAEVLSVVSSQVKSILNALKARSTEFNFQGENISLVKTCSIFITMNPGYQGRVELPENMKALFRSCSMVLPDIQLICEIMLLSAGFNDSKTMARKFTTLYSLSADLLSKQDQYDWGLRAMKTVLFTTGKRRISNSSLSQEQLLLLCLRDANLPRLVAADKEVFHGLISDLFPNVSVRDINLDGELQGTIRDVMSKLNFQPDDIFVKKVTQLHDLLEVRHSIFIMGPSGSGKSSICQVMEETFNTMGQKVILNDLDPKAIEKDELYGYVSAGEWKDGIFSSIMRNMSQMESDDMKWILIDGDIDTNWIESLNTVMDDNKVLTLASNERIQLTSQMRLIFEIDTLKYANPSTVSRAGIVYMGSNDFSWSSYMQSWTQNRNIPAEKSTLTYLFDKYISSLHDFVDSENFSSSLNVSWFSMIETLCNILNCVLPSVDSLESKQEVDRDLYELYFMFACVWAVGGSLTEDVNSHASHRANFNNWWRMEFKSIKFPLAGTVFDYQVEQSKKKFVHWSESIVSELAADGDDFEVGAHFVQTAETARYEYIIKRLVANGVPVLLVGNSGCGKTVMIENILDQMGEDLGRVDINFNHYTSSSTLQAAVEGSLERKSGRSLAPPGTRKLIYFIDDFNLPMVDEYGTQGSHSLLRQYFSYKHWYDRSKLTLTTISNIQFIASMNPTAGSFQISSRLQRHFATFALSFPAKESLKTIFGQVLRKFLVPFPSNIRSLQTVLLDAALGLHFAASKTFLPSVKKFHYQFNLRHLSRMFNGIVSVNKKALQSTQDLVRLWVHESRRVYSDILTNFEDIDKFEGLLKKTMRSQPEFGDPLILHEKPLIFSHFSEGVDIDSYSRVQTFANLKTILDTALEGYNDSHSMMDIVFFDDAMSHICRISRIIKGKNGHATLVGVGGSGKQSLARLAAYLCKYEFFQISIQKGYNFSDMKNDLATVLQIAGITDQPIVFLITDSQIVQEEFLIPVNDLLSGNDINVFTSEQMENLYQEMGKQLKAVGLMNNRENAWSMFCSNVHTNLHIVFCCSPVSPEFRTRCRNFPAITHCTSIDWFHEWPAEALRSVAYKYLSDSNVIEKEKIEPIVNYMSCIHDSVNDVSALYAEKEGKFNYTTPKSFFELLKLYRVMAEKKRKELDGNIARLETGINKLNSASEQVDEMKITLSLEEKDVEEKSVQVNAMLERVMVDQEKANKERALADAEEQKVRAIKVDVAHKQEESAKELAAAQPALDAARDALDSLDKNNLIELKSFQNPGREVKGVMAFVMILLSGNNKQARRDLSWKAAKNALSNVSRFLEQLHTFDKDNIPDLILEVVEPYLQDPNFSGEYIKPKSVAAAGICEWARNVLTYNQVYRSMKPMRAALSRANTQLMHTISKLEAVREKLSVLDGHIAKLTASFQTALNEKEVLAQKATQTQNTIALANRLVQGLALENVRWREATESYKKQRVSFIGDVLIASAYVSYTGSFSKRYRDMLLYEKWIPKLEDISVNPKFDPLSILVEDAEVAKWNNEGLPKDRFSTENAALIKHTQRWPLIIDPQLQALIWLKHKEGEEDLKIITTDSADYLDHVEKSISNGDHILIENIGEYIDPMLNSVLGGQTIKKGKYIKIGDREIDYDPNFRLYLHTKLAKPHFPPELQAQVTIINFTVTKQGLEDQLLGSVVSQERPDLESKMKALTLQQNEFKIRLKDLEDVLLAQISSAEGNFLGDTVLVESLENTKNTAQDIQNQVADTLVTEGNINEIREKYRPAAQRASIIFFLVNDLNRINSMYHFSLSEFTDVFIMSLKKGEESDEISERVQSLVSSITWNLWQYVTRALFERDELIFTSQLTFNICMSESTPNFSKEELMFLVKTKPYPMSDPCPFDWLSSDSWASISYLSTLQNFSELKQDILGSSKRWKKWSESEAPENELMPQEWKSKLIYQRLSIIKAFRVDRMKHALMQFIEEKLGTEYIGATPLLLEDTFKESSCTKPIFFILSPGLDPIKKVATLGEAMGYTEANGKFINVSLGQGQEVIAENMLEKARKEGLWLMLQNIHLAPKWLLTLEEIFEGMKVSKDESKEEKADSFRLFLTAEPFEKEQVIPIGILQSCIKITDEPPSGLKANMLVALDNIPDSSLEPCTKETDFKKILFCLCFFHAIVLERRKFGPGGWYAQYPFSIGDLLICKDVLYNYLENSIDVPWTDIRYIFGEIMYGGHIADRWDRRLCATCLETYINRDVMEGYIPLVEGINVYTSPDMATYRQNVEDGFPQETSYLFGLHPNSEIEVLTLFTRELCDTLFQLRGDSDTNQSNTSKEDRAESILEEVMSTMPDMFNIEDMMNGVVERDPYVVVAYNEVERMNSLLHVMKTSVTNLTMALQGNLSMNESMEVMLLEICRGEVPSTWEKFAYPSLKPLGPWFQDIRTRVKELEMWVVDFKLPTVIWISGLFNPQSFLTAVMQTAARKMKWSLDSTKLRCDITKKERHEIVFPARDGVYITGMYMEGARWDTHTGCIQEAFVKEITSPMPVIFLKVQQLESSEDSLHNVAGIYECPLYKTKLRGPTYVWTISLKSREAPSKWVLAGVCLLLSN
eukprot:Nk52_evm21s1400 gene=Nk52_evmTU21s1400